MRDLFNISINIIRRYYTDMSLAIETCHDHGHAADGHGLRGHSEAIRYFKVKREICTDHRRWPIWKSRKF